MNHHSNHPPFGTYGVLQKGDFHAQLRGRSFAVWLAEVQGVPDPSAMPKGELQHAYFEQYREDYNTATLPHIKYYDYDKVCTNVRMYVCMLCLFCWLVKYHRFPS